MKKEKKFALVVDDYPLMCETYKTILSSINPNETGYQFDLDVASNCDDATQAIRLAYKTSNYPDLVILDLKLTPSLDLKILSGEDLGVMVRELMPSTKIIISTSSHDNFLINNIFKSINPDGFLVKKDVNSKILKNAILNVMRHIPFYSDTILKLLRKEISNDLILDFIDRKILYELSIGARMKDLPNFIPLSAPSIEKRKKHLKKVFNVKDKGDRELILMAKQKGFI